MTVIQPLPCGCSVKGIGTLPDPVRPVLCHLHTTAQELLGAAKHADDSHAFAMGVLGKPERRVEAPKGHLFITTEALDKLRAAIAKAEKSPVRAVGYAPNDSRCGCERAGCHFQGDCPREAFFLVEAYGMQQGLCPACFRKCGAGLPQAEGCGEAEARSA